MAEAGYITNQAGLALAEIRPMSLRENIRQRIDTRLELLDKTPEIERILTLLGKSGRF